MQTQPQRHRGKQKVSDYMPPFAAPPRLHAATLTDRTHPAAGDVEHTYKCHTWREGGLFCIEDGYRHSTATERTNVTCDMGFHVCLYVPNVIGYIRILLVLSSWILYIYPESFIPLYVLSIILDGLDGWAARRLQQTSRFGAWLDVVIDNVGRSMLWNMLYDWGWLVSSVEWCVFVCNHNARGAQWKNTFTESPDWVQAVMAKGFKTPLGILTIAGLHVLPVWLYGYQHEVLSQALYAPNWLQILGIVVLAAGRLLGFAVEMWCIVTHLKFLLLDEEEEKEN